MAKAVSDDELQLKKRARRRLIGAVAIVTVVAVGLPMVLDSEPKPTAQDISIQIPSPDAAEPKGKAQPLTAGTAPAKPAEGAAAAGKTVATPGGPATKEGGAQVAAVPAMQAAPANKAEPAVKKPAEPAKPAEKPTPARKAEPAKTVEKAPATVEAKAPAEKPKASPEAAKAKNGEGQYVVQVAALADADRAKALHRKVVDGGMKAYTEVVQTANGPVTRVRVGPYPSRQAAEKARASLKKLELDGKVVPR